MLSLLFHKVCYIYTYLFFFFFFLFCFFWSSSNVMVYYFQLQVGQQCCHPPFYLHTYIFICHCMVVSLNENYKHPNLCSFHGPHIIVFSLWNLGPLYPTISYWGFLESSFSHTHKHIWLTRSLKYNVGSELLLNFMSVSEI